MPKRVPPAIKKRRLRSSQSTRKPPSVEHTEEVSDGAQQWLESELHLPNVSQALRGRSLGELREAVGLVARGSDEQLYRGLATAYALWVAFGPNDTHPLLIEMAKAVGRPLIRKDVLKIIVEALITYGEAGSQNRRKAQKLHSRDVQAIGFLHRSGVSPAKVVSLSKRKGQGVQAWAKSAAAHRKPRNLQNANKTAQDKAHSVVWTMPDGTKLPMSFYLDNERLSKIFLHTMIFLQEISMHINFSSERRVA